MRDALDLFTPIALRKRATYEKPYAVLTLHRAANTEPERLRGSSLRLGETGWTFVFPVHPRTRHVMDEHADRAGAVAAGRASASDTSRCSRSSRALRASATDSGGLQKEAYWLRVPCVTLRPSTEWMDTVRAGANTLVDPDDLRDLGSALERASFPDDAPTLYGDGKAAGRIVDALYPSRPE